MPDPIPDGFASRTTEVIVSPQAQADLLLQALLLAIRDHNQPLANRLLEHAEALVDASNREARGQLAYCRGSLRYHESRIGEAISSLVEAVEILGMGHRLAALLVGLLGSIYADSGSFSIPRALFEKSVALGKTRNDLEAIAQAHGNMGRLFLNPKFQLGFGPKC